MSDLRNYLETMDEMMRMHPNRPTKMPFSSVEGMVLKYGKAFESKPLSAEDMNTALVARVSIAPRLKDCFRVATQFVLDWHDEGAVYVEGYASSGILPVHHAWVSMHGSVVDLTWRRDKKGKANPHGQRRAGWCYRAQLASSSIDELRVVHSELHGGPGIP